MRVLVTGAAGFTGTCMMQFLSHETGVEMTGLVRKPSQKSLLSHTPCIVADLLERGHLITAVDEICPDAIIHLGGLTRGDLGDLLRVNVVGTKNILDAGYKANADCRMLVISSSAVYGYAGTTPIAESVPLHPLSEYGISKAAQEALALMHQTQSGALISIARPFNLAGPGQPASFICGRLVKQVADSGQKKKTALELLETSSSRDLIDVRDVVRGYWALVSHPDFSGKCSGNAFNLGSGNAYSISTIIAMIEEITNRHYEVNLPRAISRAAIPSQQSDNARITALTGWRPEISLPETLRDMLAVEMDETSGKKMARVKQT
jgi:nucleoside-diphosphate-sugar epimerase